MHTVTRIGIGVCCALAVVIEAASAEERTHTTPPASTAILPAPVPKKGDHALAFYKYKLRSERLERMLWVWRGGRMDTRRAVGGLERIAGVDPDGYTCLTRADRLRVRRAIMRTLPLPATRTARPYTAGAREVIAADPRAAYREYMTSPEAAAPLPGPMANVVRVLLDIRDAHRHQFHPFGNGDHPDDVCKRERRKRRAKARRERKDLMSLRGGER